ncbi:MAG: PQQ-like beta-propeller repeat protein [Nitrospirae bacterium]|nr:PQQ-like beta-propeller repeat protein [Nitrospirota bacterium]
MKRLTISSVSFLILVLLASCGRGGELSSGNGKALSSSQMVNLSSTSASTGSWPMFHHDAQHTGQSAYNGPQANTLKWEYTSNSIANMSSFDSSSLSLDGSTLYVTAANSLLALSTANSSIAWTASISGGGATAVASDGTVYAVGGTQLYAFTSSGASKWVYSVGTGLSSNIHGEPCIGSDGTIYIGSWNTYVYALKSDGTLKWKYQTAGSIAPLASPSLSPDGSTVYVGSGDANYTTDGTLYALNSSDGTLKWSKKSIRSGQVGS